jgi:hypothetical protein
MVEYITRFSGMVQDELADSAEKVFSHITSDGTFTVTMRLRPISPTSGKASI